ncbi:MAG: carboxypeptidase regulatory-like domain-containing protein [Chitinophagales bacterium]|nr:carboxypeptidase regulatory-like domain-containing protein [Chitinophagales bacterium]
MKNILSFSILLTLFLGLSLAALAQDDNRTKKADDLFNQFAFPEAAEAYKKLLAKDENIPQAKIKIAECYRLMNMPVEAEYWYEQVVDLPESEPIHKYYYGMALKANGKYEEAKQVFLQYAQLVPPDTRGLRQVEACEQANYFMTDPGIYAPILAQGVNSEKADFGPAFYNDGIVFASETGVKNRDQIYRWTDAPFLDLLFAKREGDDYNKLGKPENFKGKVNTWLHEGTVTFTSDFKTMYFTRNNYNNGKVGYDTEEILKTVKLQIFESKAQGSGGDKWSEVKPLPFNNDNYSVGHPTLSKDGQALYFVSDMPGGYGGTDIYVSYKSGDSWGQPENLGPEINTEGSEMFPFISSDGTLYFSSDALPGLGSLDIFASKLLPDGTWSAPENLRYPVNTNADDFAFIIDEKNEKGYFSSNRTGGKGSDDIYSFTKLNNVMTGVVVDCKTQEPIEGADVQLLENERVVQKRSTNVNGTFSFPISPGKEYTVNASKMGYQEGSRPVSTVGITSTQVEIKIPICPEAEEDSTKVGDGTDGDGEDGKGGPCMFALSGKVTDRKTQRGVEGVLITVTNLDTRQERTLRTNGNGEYSINLDANSDYVVNANKTYYLTENKSLTTKGKDCNIASEQSLRQDFSMAPIDMNNLNDGNPLNNPMLGDDSGKQSPDGPSGFILNHIYYDFDKDAIREDARPELDKVLDLVSMNPGLQIELRAHTDCRGSNEYNQNLSDRRAKAAYEYLISRGGANVSISSNLSPKGYGEAQPVNECVDGVPCANAKHQENRRTEFVIIGYNPSGAVRSLPRYYSRNDFHVGKDYYKNRPAGGSSNGSYIAPKTNHTPSSSTNSSSNSTNEVEETTIETPSYKDTTNEFTPKGTNAPTFYDLNDAVKTMGVSKATNTGTEYKIQLTSSRTPDLSKYNALNQYGDLVIEPSSTGSQRVILGTFTNKTQAEEALAIVKNKGYSDAFLITYKDGIREGR